jgi:hypothetical protein
MKLFNYLNPVSVAPISVSAEGYGYVAPTQILPESGVLSIYGLQGISVMIIFAFVLSSILITISYLLSLRKWDPEKLSPYECGFEPFGDARQKFDIRYYLVSLLFILFDL